MIPEDAGQGKSLQAAQGEVLPVPTGCCQRQGPSWAPLPSRPLAWAPAGLSTAPPGLDTEHGRVEARQQAWPQEPGPLGALEGLQVLGSGGQPQTTSPPRATLAGSAAGKAAGR